MFWNIVYPNNTYILSPYNNLLAYDIVCYDICPSRAAYLVSTYSTAWYGMPGVGTVWYGMYPSGAYLVSPPLYITPLYIFPPSIIIIFININIPDTKPSRRLSINFFQSLLDTFLSRKD